MKKILYITTISSTINAFLVPHIQMLRNQGHMVDCACSIDIPIDDSLIMMELEYLIYHLVEIHFILEI